MVFLIQNTLNPDSDILRWKLDELIGRKGCAKALLSLHLLNIKGLL